MAKTREEKLAHAQAALEKSSDRLKKLLAGSDRTEVTKARITLETDKCEKLQNKCLRLGQPVISPEARKEIRILQNAVDLMQKYAAPASTTNPLLVLVGELQKVTA